MKKHHDISSLKFEDGFLVITIDGEHKKFALKKISPALEKASEQEKNNFEISPSGYGVNYHRLKPMAWGSRIQGFEGSRSCEKIDYAFT